MKTATLAALSVVAMLAFCQPAAYAQQSSAGQAVDVPHLISYQGVIDGLTGTPIPDGQHTITVRFYSDASGTGGDVWEDHFTVTTANGVFSLLLGSQKPLPTPSEMGSGLWVSTSIDNGTAGPLTQLAAAPYAMTVANGAITAQKMGTDYVGSISLNGQTVSSKGGDVNFTAGTGVSLNFDPTTNAIIVGGTSAGTGSGKGDAVQDNNSVHKITGTENQVFVNGTYGTGLADYDTLTLPQDIATSSSPSFDNLTLSGKATSAATSSGDPSSTLTTKGYVDNEVNTAVSGTTNTMAKFTNAHVVGNSSVTDNGTTFGINGTNFTVDEATGNTSIAGTLGTAGTITDGGNLSVAGTSTMSGATEIDGLLTLDGLTHLPLPISGILAVDASNHVGYRTPAEIFTTAANNWILNQNSTPQPANFEIAGSGAIGTTLSVGGASTFGGNMSITGSHTLSVGGNTTFNSNVGIGMSPTGYALDVNGDAHFSGAITLGSPLAIANGGTGMTMAPTATGQYLRSLGTSWTVGSLYGSDLIGDINGNAGNVNGVVAIANGGTGMTMAPTATGQYLRSLGTSWTVGSLYGSDLIGDINGNAGNVNGVVAIANGGTGITTAPTAQNQFLRANPTGTSWSVGQIGLSDLPGAGTLTVSAGAGLSGGGAVALGSAISLAIDPAHSNAWTAQQTFTDASALAASARFFNTFANAVGQESLATTITSNGAGAGTNIGIAFNVVNAANNTDIRGTGNSWSVDNGGNITTSGNFKTTGGAITSFGNVNTLSGSFEVNAVDVLSGTTLGSSVVNSSLTSVGAQAQALNMNSHPINNVTDPSNLQDAATKHYVDQSITNASPDYIQNGTSVQSGANFNIGDNGVIGGSLGMGTNAPAGELANTASNDVMNSVGENSQSFHWADAQGGWAAFINNTGTGGSDNGLGIYLADNSSSSDALNIESYDHYLMQLTGDGTITFGQLGTGIVQATSGTLSAGNISEGEVTNLTSDLASKEDASNVTNDARAAFSAGSGITISSGVIAATNAGSYIDNSTSQQASANFNISGTGIIGGNETVGGTNITLTHSNPVFGTPEFPSGGSTYGTLTIQAGKCYNSANYATDGANLLLSGGGGISDGVHGISLKGDVTLQAGWNSYDPPYAANENGSIVFQAGNYDAEVLRISDYTDHTSGAATGATLAFNLNGGNVSAGNTIQVGTDGSNGNGAYLTNGGTWTNASSRNFKDRFSPLNGEDVLSKIENLDIEGWYYKGTDEYHIGPIAEDFYSEFRTGNQDNLASASTHISSVDPAGISLIGVQELAKKYLELAKQNAEQATQNAKLESQVDQLTKEIEAIKASLQKN